MSTNHFIYPFPFIIYHQIEIQKCDYDFNYSNQRVAKKNSQCNIINVANQTCTHIQVELRFLFWYWYQSVLSDSSMCKWAAFQQYVVKESNQKHFNELVWLCMSHAKVEGVRVREMMCWCNPFFENCKANYIVHTHTLLSKMKWCINTNSRWQKQCLPCSTVSSLSVTCIINAWYKPDKFIKTSYAGCNNDYRTSYAATWE